MIAVQNLKEAHVVNEEVTGLRNDVRGVGHGVEYLRNDTRDLGDWVEWANNKLNVILHGAHLVFIRSSIPF